MGEGGGGGLRGDAGLSPWVRCDWDSFLVSFPGLPHKGRRYKTKEGYRGLAFPTKPSPLPPPPPPLLHLPPPLPPKQPNSLSRTPFGKHSYPLSLVPNICREQGQQFDSELDFPAPRASPETTKNV